jgi:Amino acid permease
LSITIWVTPGNQLAKRLLRGFSVLLQDFQGPQRVHPFSCSPIFQMLCIGAVSIVGAMNGMILTGPRVYYAMAKEGLFFRSFASIQPGSHAPILAILIQGIWAACLTLLGTFQELFTYVIFTAWMFYSLAVAAVIVLRIRRPGIARPFEVSALSLAHCTVHLCWCCRYCECGHFFSLTCVVWYRLDSDRITGLRDVFGSKAGDGQRASSGKCTQLRRDALPFGTICRNIRAVWAGHTGRAVSV